MGDDVNAVTTSALGTGPVRLRSTFRQWSWLLGTVTAVYLLTQSMLALAFSGAPALTEPFLVSAATFFSTWIVGSAILCRWQGVTLTRSALYVHSLRPRAIPWPDIAWLSTDLLLGTTYVIVWETSGRSTRLRAPITGPLAWDDDFDAKYQTIRAWHQALSGSPHPD
jgi:hypothetical protein